MKQGVLFALLAALLFGAGTPFAKLLLTETQPVLLAGLLYAASGIGLMTWIGVRRVLSGQHAQPAPRWSIGALAWFAAAILAGGVLGPVLLMTGLALIPATTAALLLNMEGVFTALLAWFVFKENFDRRILLGMLCIVLGGGLIAWSGQLAFGNIVGAAAVVGACACWGLDNNLTRKVSAADSVSIAAVKGLVAGAVNLTIAAYLGSPWPAWPGVLAAGTVGLAGYGLSLVFFVLALRHLGAARTGAYFSTAPFIGAGISLLLFRQMPGYAFWVAAALMGIGVWLHLTERHSHRHTHERMRHSHGHVHDEHHQHQHDFEWDGSEPHTHEHVHEPLIHTHPHYPDIHHRHGH
jgi:drug/metabolite transporter (DMT)-like permease